MARHWFGGSQADQVVTRFNFGSNDLVALAAGVMVTYWDAEADGTQYTDLLLDGTTGASFTTTDADGYVPRFQGPDAVQAMWADVGSDQPRRIMVTTDAAIDLSTQLASRIAVVEKGAVDGVAELDASGKIVQPVPAALVEGVLAEARIPTIFQRLMFLDSQPGVATDGATECGAAIQAAIDAAEAANLMLIAGRRVYVTTSTLTFKEPADFYDATISYSGTGTAVVIGDDVNGVTRQHFRMGRVVNTLMGTGWGAVTGSIGVKIVDVNKSRVDIRSVTQFDVGVKMLGHARGCTYNEIHVTDLNTNRINMQQTADAAAGWCNQNLVVGGSWNHDSVKAGGTGIAGTAHVLQDASGGGPVPDTNTFLACAFEGNVVEYMVDSTGKMNMFRDCRWEATTPKVRWGAASYGNAIRDGYKPELITVTNSGEASNVVTWPASGDIAEIVIRPQDMHPVVGTPALGAILRHPVMNSANGGVDVVAFTTRLPANWHTYDVDVQYSHDTAGSGTISWTWRVEFDGDGDTLTQPGGGVSSSAAAAPAQRVKKVVTVAAAQAPTAGKQMTANLFAGGGTFSGTIGILAVVLRRRS